MKVLPIIFQPEMVRGLIRAVEHKPGAKTQTRRLRWGKPTPTGGKPKVGEEYLVGPEGVRRLTPLARVKAGDVLYVRENFALRDCPDDKPGQQARYAKFFADVDGPPNDPMDFHPYPTRWRPSIHCPRHVSRLTLAVTEVRFEPVQNISPDDAAAEGLVYAENGDAAGFWFDDEPERAKCHGDGSVECYRELWKRINGEESWAENPEVVVLTFEVHRQNVDDFLRAGANVSRETSKKI